MRDNTNAIRGAQINLKQGSKVDTFSASVASGAGVAVTGFSVAITPTTATSKILVMVSSNVANGAGVVTESIGLRLKRNSTDVGLGTPAGNRLGMTSGTFGGQQAHGTTFLGLTYLDDPQTTSPITYSIEIFNGTSVTRTLILNTTTNDAATNQAHSFRFASYIVAMEVPV